MRLIRPAQALPEVAERMGLPPPRNGHEEEGLLDRWEADLASRLALLSAIAIVPLFAALGAMGSYEPILTATLQAPLLLAITVLALFGLIMAIWALALESRSRLPARSRLFGLGVAAGLAISPATLLLLLLIQLAPLSS